MPLEIVKYPHPALRRSSRPLTAVDQRVRELAAHMLELMYAHKGLGLAANQVALPYRMIVLNPSGDREKKDQEGVYLNPVILERKGAVEEDEGCLSLPGLFAKVRRAKTVRIQAYNLQGEAVEKTVGELEARAWQHEIDHLDGVLFIDKLGTVGRLASRKALQEFEDDYLKAQERGDIPPDDEIEKRLDELEATA
jgi:peptide deformylase